MHAAFVKTALII